MATIKTAVENYTGNRAGIAFVNGVGETTDPHLIEWFGAHGYTVEVEEVEQKKRKSSKSDNQQ